MEKSKFALGSLLIVVSVIAIYVSMGDDVRMRVDNDKSVIYVNESNRWLIGGIEEFKMVNGTKTVHRIRSGIKRTDVFDNITNITTINRITPYKGGCVVNATWSFDGKNTDVENFPVYHTIERINCSGLRLEVDWKRLKYDGETIKGVTSPQSFGRNMKVEWDGDYYYSRIWKYKWRDEGKLTVKWRTLTDYEVVNVRLFDPPTDISTCTTLNSAGTTYHLTADITNSGSSTCMDITANNITLDCQGHIIDGIDGLVTTGIKINRGTDTVTNITLNNCSISDWEYGISISKSNYNIVSNFFSTSNRYYGITLFQSNYNNFTNITSNDNGYHGISLGSSSDYNILDNLTLKNNNDKGIVISYSDNNILKSSTIQDNVNYGILLYNADTNIIYNNLFNNTNNFDVDVHANNINTTKQIGTRIYSFGTQIGGNYWTNSTGNGYSDICTDINTDGFCDSSYTLNFANIDYLPLSDEFQYMNFSSPTPDNYYAQLSDTFTVNVSLKESNPTNFTYRLYNSTLDLINETTYTSYPTAIIWTVTDNNTFYYNVTACDSSGNYWFTKTRLIRINTNIIILSPENRTYDIIDIDLNWSSSFTPEEATYYLNRYSEEKWYVNYSNMKGYDTIMELSPVETFYIGDDLYTIVGCYNIQKDFVGYKWNGSEWQDNDTIVYGLVTSDDRTIPTVFEMSGTTYTIVGDINGDFCGYQWNGIGWDVDNDIKNGLTDVGTNSRPEVIQIYGTWYLLLGRTGDDYGYNWTGTEWQRYDDILNGFDKNIYKIDTFFMDNYYYSIIDDGTYNTYGYKWDGEKWNSDDIDDGLTWGASDYYEIGDDSFLTVNFEGDYMIYSFRYEDRKNISLYENFELLSGLIYNIDNDTEDVVVNSDYIYFGTENGDIYMWNTNDRTYYGKIDNISTKLSGDTISLGSLHLDSEYLYAGAYNKTGASEDGWVFIWYINNLTFLDKLETYGHRSGYTKKEVIYSDDDYIYEADYNKGIYVWYKNNISFIKTLNTTEDNDMAYTVCANDNYIYGTSVRTDKSFNVWYRNNFTLRQSLGFTGAGSNIYCNNDYVYLGDWYGNVSIFNVTTLNIIKNLTFCSSESVGTAQTTGVHVDDDYIYSLHWDKDLCVWNKTDYIIKKKKDTNSKLSLYVYAEIAYTTTAGGIGGLGTTIGNVDLYGTKFINTTLDCFAGSNNVIVYATDSSGNLYSDQVYFFVNDTLDLYLNGQNNYRVYELGTVTELQINTTLSDEDTNIYVEDKLITTVNPNATYNWTTETFNYTTVDFIVDTNISYSYNTYDDKLYGLFTISTNGSVTDISVNEFTLYGDIIESIGTIDKTYIDDTTIAFTTPGIETTYLNVTEDSEDIIANFTIKGSTTQSTQTRFGNGYTTQDFDFNVGGGNKTMRVSVPRHATLISANVTLTGTKGSVYKTELLTENVKVIHEYGDEIIYTPGVSCSENERYDTYTRAIGLKSEKYRKCWSIDMGGWSCNWDFTRDTHSYLQYSHTNYEAIQEATLYLYRTDFWTFCHYPPCGTFYVKEVVDDSWDENTLTWQTKPTFGSSLYSELMDDLYYYTIEVDLTSYAKQSAIQSMGFDESYNTRLDGCSYGSWEWGHTGFDFASRTHGTNYPYIKIYHYPSTFKIDTASDGIYDYEVSILNITDQEIELNYTAMQDYIDNQCTTDVCSVPLLMSSATDGEAQFKDLKVVYSMTPYNVRMDVGGETVYTSSGVLNETSIMVYEIDTTDSRIPIEIHNDRTGTVTIESLDLTYTVGEMNTSNIDWFNISAGNWNGNKTTAEITMYYDGSANMTIKVNNSYYSAEHEAEIYYSNVNQASAYDYWEIFPRTLNSKNVTPYGQSYSVPFDNFTALNEHNYNMSIYYNGTMDACIDIRACTTYDQSNCITVNATPQLFDNGNLTTPIPIYYYTDLNDCNWSARYYDITWYYPVCCEKCEICDKI